MYTPVAYYRGLIEFSNRCIKNCNYCGIRRENDKTERFDMNREDIIKMAQWAYDHEYGSITSNLVNAVMIYLSIMW